MNNKTQLLFTWTGPIAIVLFFVGVFPLAHLLPPPISPLTPPDQIMAFYAHNRIGILLGEFAIMWAASIMAPFFVVMHAQLRRMESRLPLTSTIFLIAAVIVILEIILQAWIFVAIAFRETHAIEVTIALSDVAWLMFVWPNQATCLLLVSIGFAILSDRSSEPLFPRWLGFMQYALAILYVPSTFMPLFYSGPLTWSGLLSFWVPAIDWGSWFILMFFMVRRAVQHPYLPTVEAL